MCLLSRFGRAHKVGRSATVAMFWQSSGMNLPRTICGSSFKGYPQLCVAKNRHTKSIYKRLSNQVQTNRRFTSNNGLLCAGSFHENIENAKQKFGPSQHRSYSSLMYPKVSCPCLSNLNVSKGRALQETSITLSRRLYSRESDNPDSDLVKMFKDDPEVKGWLKQMGEDFTPAEPPAPGEAEGSESSRSPSSSSSNTDSSDSDSDSELGVAKIKESPSIHMPCDMVLQSEDPLSKFDTTELALSEANIDGTVQNEEEDEDEFEVEEEYEDFYHEHEDIEVMPERDIPISLERGATGVYDIDELVLLLEDENARDICVIQIPEELKYAEYMVIVTGRSTRHLKAMAEFVQVIFKKKRVRSDPHTVKIEGQTSKDWMALDLGNIVLHLFTEEARTKYDLETLWTVGAEFDAQAKEEEDPFALFIDQAWGPSVETQNEGKPRVTHSTQPHSMDSVAGWHGPVNPST